MSGIQELMTAAELAELARRPDLSRVEEQWLRIAEAVPNSPRLPVQYVCVLEEVAKSGRVETAASMAQVAIEALAGSQEPKAALDLASRLLLAVGEGEEVRRQVCDLYRQVYADREGLEELLVEAGLPSGRPVRRALRTLEVALALSPGDYVAAREDDGVARVVEMDTKGWKFRLDADGATETLSAVHLADRYRPASSNEFRVQRVVNAEQLRERLQDEPLSVIADLCRDRGGEVTSEQIEAQLVPALLTGAQWKKWWTAARGQLRTSRQFSLEGRTPVTVRFQERPASADEELLEHFKDKRDPITQLKLIEEYVRECRTRNADPSQEVIRQCLDHLMERARRHAKSRDPHTGVYMGVACRVGELIGDTAPRGELTAWLTGLTSLRHVLTDLESKPLYDVVLTALEQARPADWKELLAEALPELPAAGCEAAAARLLAGGFTTGDFAPVVEHILTAPVPHFEALAWLWDGAGQGAVTDLPPVTVLSKLLGVLEHCRHDDTLPKAQVKDITARARSVLSARRYERFEQLLGGLEPAMGSALKTRITRLDNLGRSVHEDLLKMIRTRFPDLDAKPKLAPWERPDVLFTTAEGLSRRQAEADELVNVKMKENARAIGAAAEHGDLSENSEYKFALEERDLLRARLAQMNSELAMAQAFSAEEVPTDHVGIGTRIVMRRKDDGATLELCFMGPWDASTERGIFNYKAPMAERLLGRRVGDVVEIEYSGAPGKYEIVELRNGLLE